MVVVNEPLVEGEPLKVGSQFLWVTEENGQRMEFQAVVTQHDELKAHTSIIRGKVFDIEAQYLFENPWQFIDPRNPACQCDRQGLPSTALRPDGLTDAEAGLPAGAEGA